MASSLVFYKGREKHKNNVTINAHDVNISAHWMENTVAYLGSIEVGLS